MKPLTAPQLNDKIGVLVLGIVWAAAFISMRYLVEFITPMEVAFWRVLIASVILGFWIKITRIKYNIKQGDVKNIIGYGFIGIALPFILLTTGSQFVSGGEVSLLSSTSPFISLVINHFMTKDDKANRYKVLGAVIGFIGVLLILWDGVQLGADNFLSKGMIIMALSLYVVSSLLMRKSSHLPAIVYVYFSLIVASIILLLLVFIVDGGMNPLTYDMNVISVLLYLGAVPTAIGWSYRFVLTNRVGYSFVSLVGYIIPIAGLIMGNIFLGEEVSPNIAIALILVMLGLWVSAYRKKINNL